MSSSLAEILKEDEHDLLAAEAVEQRKKLIGRECGECSLCCRLFPVQELNKPANVWCKHCQPGGGCTIYAQRPPICRGFACGWLLGDMSDDWFPKRAGMVIKAFHKVRGQTQMTIVVDPRAVVRIGRHRYLILPYGEIDISNADNDSGCLIVMA